MFVVNCWFSLVQVDALRAYVQPNVSLRMVLKNLNSKKIRTMFTKKTVIILKDLHTSFNTCR